MSAFDGVGTRVIRPVDRQDFDELVERVVKLEALGASASQTEPSPTVEPLRVSPADAASVSSRDPAAQHPVWAFYEWLHREYAEPNPEVGEAVTWIARPLMDALTSFCMAEGPFEAPAPCDEHPKGEDAQAAELRSNASAVDEVEAPSPDPRKEALTVLEGVDPNIAPKVYAQSLRDRASVIQDLSGYNQHSAYADALLDEADRIETALSTLSTAPHNPKGAV